MATKAEDLARSLASEDAKTRHAALSRVRIEECVGQVLSLVVKALEDDGGFDETVPEWTGLTGETYRSRVADAAARTIAGVGVAAAEALLDALSDGAGANTRATLAEVVIGREQRLDDASLGRLVARLEARVAADVLAARLHRRLSWEVERRAGRAAADAVLDRLAAQLDAEDADLRADAVWALGHAKGSRRAAEILLARLPSTIAGIGEALLAIGPVLDDAGVGRLADAIAPYHGTDSLRRAAAAYADPRIASALVAWLESPRAHSQADTAKLLAGMGPAAESVRARLSSLLVSRDHHARSVAWVALGGAAGLRDDERDAFLAMQSEAIANDVPAVDVAKLVELGPRASSLVPVAIARLEDVPSAGFSPGVLINALGSMGEAARPAVPAMAKFLASSATEDVVLRALARLGPIAAEAEEAVKAFASRVRDPKKQKAAEATLAAIRG